MQRRRLLQIGLAGAALVAAAGAGVSWWRPGWQANRLTPDGRALLGAVSAVVLGPLMQPAQQAALLDRIEQTVNAFAPQTRTELARLLALLAAPPTRRALTGLTDDWPSAPPAEIAAALERLRHSGLTVRRQIYHALRDLVTAAWFADASAWAAIGYPGPRRLAA